MPQQFVPDERPAGRSKTVIGSDLPVPSSVMVRMREFQKIGMRNRAAVQALASSAKSLHGFLFQLTCHRA